ncbi:nuclear transport factor 2 family protein [Aquipuribacter sp. SD81]|uniref:nuclear transport factor 2 family protein n=1 Tax=Aquipuribacter sp. SD81 TaxID=3127703 RepID=UPI00301A57D9
MGVAEELLGLERQGWDSLCRGTGDAFYGGLMTDDALMVLADGTVLDREAVVASLADAPPWDDYDIADVRTVRPTGDVATLVYTGTGRRGDTTFIAVMSSTYVRRDGRWRLALYQQTVRP